MKKIFSLLLLFLTITLNLKSQSVDSIKVEQLGELIKINYKILNSAPDQVFKVTVLCSINGGLQSVLKSLSGDYGDNVVGGRSDYMVIWDVLKDVDEVKSVDFSVRAELKSGNPSSQITIKDKPLKKRRFHTQFVIDSKAQNFGLRLGFMGKWGLSPKYLSGTWIGATELLGTEDVNVPFTCYSLDITKRLINTEKVQMHLMIGPAFGQRNGDRYADRFTNYSGMFSGIDWGIMIDINRFCVSVEMTELLDFYSVPDFVCLGLGMRF